MSRDHLAICTALYVDGPAVQYLQSTPTADDWPIRVAGKRLLDSIGRYFRTSRFVCPIFTLG